VSTEIQYPDHFIERLHIVRGEGFLSPGGPDEVREIVRGIDLAGKVVLDIGFGTGFPANSLAKKNGATKVVGIDVEPRLSERAVKNARSAGVAE